MDAQSSLKEKILNMKIFDLCKEQVKKIKVRQILITIFSSLIGLSLLVTFIFISNRDNYIYFMIGSIILSFIFFSISLFFLTFKLRQTRQYELIINKAENNLQSDVFVFVSCDESICIKDGINYKRITMKKDDNISVFNMLFDKKMDFLVDKVYLLKYIDDIVLEIEEKSGQD